MANRGVQVHALLHLAGQTQDLLLKPLYLGRRDEAQVAAGQRTVRHPRDMPQNLQAGLPLQNGCEMAAELREH